MKLIHNINDTAQEFASEGMQIVDVFARASHAQALSVLRALYRWNPVRTGLMRDNWEYGLEPDGVRFFNFVRYAGYNDRDDEAREIVLNAIDFDQLVSEVLDG